MIVSFSIHAKTGKTEEKKKQQSHLCLYDSKLLQNTSPPKVQGSLFDSL